jgi:predicted component of type VI protein secretion system
MTRLFVGDELGFEVQPLLSTDDVPVCSLGADDGQRLGWSMWMPTPAPPESIVQPIFDARAAAFSATEVATL